MSCSGCKWATKHANCDMSYSCNTTGEKPVKVDEDKKGKSSKRNTGESVNG